MARLIFNILIALVAITGGVYQFYLKPILTVLGYYGRVIEPVGNMNCIAVPELKACEKVVIHQPSGVVYLACSTPASRTHWTPAVLRLNESGASHNDYVATYDPKTSLVTRLKPVNFDSPRGLSLHGMDVVPSSADSSELFVYLVNHRAPTGGQLAKEVGADSVVEIFKTKVGSTLTHVKTVEDSVISTPNDVIGYGNGKSFYVTNDHGVNKVGLIRELDVLGRKSTSVGYCHIDHGCKYAIAGIHGSNGITKAANDTIYVGNAVSGGVTILERQNDNSLVITDKVKTDYPLDNLSVDSEGHLWAAGFPDGITLIFKHFADPSVPAPSAALRISINTGPTAFYGDKYKVDKVFEDDGKITSGTTSVAYDVQRKKLYLHG